MNTRELQFRHELRDLMKGIWEITWHEDGRVNPGVPDMSVVSNGSNPAGYETTWIELKAPIPKIRLPLGMEPSQIQWIDTHKTKVPILILARFPEGVYWCRPQLSDTWKATLDYQWILDSANFIENSRIRTKLSDLVKNVSARR